MIRPFLLLWISAFGGCIGSFLNVVVYRLPRGRNLAYPGSACPACEHAIRPIHNVPVLGWLLLRGRCYDCQARISIRYPLVEALVASLFLLLAYRGPLAADALIASPVAWQAFAYQGLLLCLLLSLVLIELDGNLDGQVRFPAKTVFGSLLVGLIAPLAQPSLHPIELATPVDSLLNSLHGGLVGFLFGLMILPTATFGPMGPAGRWFVLSNAALIGVFLGPAPAVAILTLGAMIHVVVALFGGKRLPVSVTVFVLTLLTLLVVYPAAIAPPVRQHLGAWGIALLATLAASLASRAVCSRSAL